MRNIEIASATKIDSSHDSYLFHSYNLGFVSETAFGRDVKYF